MKVEYETDAGTISLTCQSNLHGGPTVTIEHPVTDVMYCEYESTMKVFGVERSTTIRDGWVWWVSRTRFGRTLLRTTAKANSTFVCLRPSNEHEWDIDGDIIGVEPKESNGEADLIVQYGKCIGCGKKAKGTHLGSGYSFEPYDDVGNCVAEEVGA